MDNKHTPGPWKAEFANWGEGDYTRGFAIIADQKKITGINVSIHQPILPANEGWFRTDIHITPEEAEANCRLLCAAPALLEALQELVRFEQAITLGAERLQYPDNLLKAITTAKAAIKQATNT